MLRISGPLIVAGMVAVVSHHLQPPSSSSTTSVASETSGAVTVSASSRPDGPVGLGASGDVPAGVTVFDTDVPGVTRLDPDLANALRRAARDAETDGIRFVVNSGWRSAEYQERLFRDAVRRYGSKGEAARWVATPKNSAHVAGEAVDLAPGVATAWLSEHGAGYGLCQIYRNEPWHYELRPDAVDDGCPRMYADPTKDPRMRE